MTEKKSDKPAVIIAVALLAIILVGEVIVYTSDFTDYSAEASLEGNTLSFQISADGSKTYSIVVNDNGAYDGIDYLYIYYDESYPSNYEDVDVSIGAQALNQEYYLEQVVNLLKPRNFHDITYLNAEQLAIAMTGDLASGKCGDIGLLVISGALPDTVYTGNASDTIFQWMSAGGSLYWLGNLIGEYCATIDGLQQVENYQELFFGAECLNTEGIDTAYNEVDSNEYTPALALQNNSVKYAVDGEKIPDDRDHLSIGFSNDRYSSITLVQYGSGMICVLGGDYSNYQRNDLVQIISSGLGPQSTIVSLKTGTVTNGTESGEIENITGKNLSAYIYLGGYYPVYSNLIWL